MVLADDQFAFQALCGLLDGSNDGRHWSATSPAFERLREALIEEPARASSLDLAVLLRQALQREFARREHSIPPTVVIKHPRMANFANWDLVGLRAQGEGSYSRVVAEPWLPTWLQASAPGVEAYAASEIVLRKFAGPEVEGDPFLASLGRSRYRSVGQRAAVRAALSTPPGGVLVIALPTGEGKSMIFQLVQSVGFVGRRPDVSGVTLVIVPTLALAINHEEEATRICRLSLPLAYEGGSDADNAVIADRIENGTIGLCFASPEAACGSLRSSLRLAAERGYLRALVVDEAHLVDQWGTGFRSDFQALSSLRQELAALGPEEFRMRTLLLSATLTNSSSQTLRSLFGTDGTFDDIASAQLRPEPDYWVSDTVDEPVRIARVLEALHHVPRPAVLYVTKVSDAESWFDRLRACGFKRVAKLHGRSSQTQRETVVKDWKLGRLDVVVGTSAFGLGIDYSHARTVIHACVPETLDRFYQEVGRAGRDGWASLSILVPAVGDYRIAKMINKQTVIGAKRGIHRWAEMFQGKVRSSSGRWAVRLDGRPGTDEADIDMFGDTNTEWNLKTLALMARAGLVKLHGSLNMNVSPGQWLDVEILDEGHLEHTVWATQIEPLRREISRAGIRNWDLMREFIARPSCPADVLEALYGAERVSKQCSRCVLCRADPFRCHRGGTVPEPRAPWRSPPSPAIERLLGHDGRLLVTYSPENISRSDIRRLGSSLKRLQSEGLSKLVQLGPQRFDMTKLLSFATDAPFFVSVLERLAMSRLPLGPEFIMVGEGAQLSAQNITARPDTPRIFLVPEAYVGPDGRRLKDVFGSRTLTLDEFQTKVAE